MLRQFFRKVRHKIRGLLDVAARFIAVDPQLHPKRQVFLKHHEIAHDALPWHREILVATSEWDLSPNVRSLFEKEANRFAGHTIFQLDHMAADYRGRRLKMADLGGLAARYGASLSATARQYVIVQDIPAALLVGKPDGAVGDRGVRFYDGIANDAFLKEFGAELLGNGLRSTHPLCVAVNEPECGPVEFELQVKDANGTRRMLFADGIYTTHEVLILFHPVHLQRQHFAFHLLRNRAA
jgi:hypothetical protein